MRQRTVSVLARLAEECFSFTSWPGNGMTPRHVESTDWLAELLFEHELPRLIVNTVRGLRPEAGAIKKFVLHWLWEQPEREELTARFAAALLSYVDGPPTEHHFAVHGLNRDAAVRELELDGYRWSNGKLIRYEENAFDTGDQEGALVELYRSLRLDGIDQLKHDLAESDKLYGESHWGAAISHARAVMETVLRNVALASLPADKQPGPKTAALQIRERLRDAQFITGHEFAMIDALWKLLSEQGDHPNMSPQESARICRQYALSAAHFLLLRWDAARPARP